jgi:hypothetical protein
LEGQLGIVSDRLEGITEGADVIEDTCFSIGIALSRGSDRSLHYGLSVDRHQPHYDPFIRDCIATNLGIASTGALEVCIGLGDLPQGFELRLCLLKVFGIFPN